MKVSSAAALVALTGLLAGCASATQSPSLPAGSMAIGPLGKAPSNVVYVANYGGGDVVLLDGTSYAEIGTISTGISGPQDVTLDAAGNLYVANTIGDSITEYAPGGTHPTFRYDTALRGPVTVTVDATGHVFEIDRDWSGTSTIREFNQGTNVPRYSCTLTGQLEGAAVRNNGDVFVSYNAKGLGGKLGVYRGGLSGCQLKTFAVHLYSTGSIALDNAGNIVVPDPNGERVVVVDPPYAKIKRHFPARYFFPYHVSIDPSNATVLLADVEKDVLYVIDYANGKIVKKLDGTDIGIAYGAVRSPNAR